MLSLELRNMSHRWGRGQEARFKELSRDSRGNRIKLTLCSWINTMFAPRPLATLGAVNSILNLGSTDRGVAEATAPWRVGREEGGSSFEFALDLRRDAALLAAGVD